MCENENDKKTRNLFSVFVESSHWKWGVNNALDGYKMILIIRIGEQKVVELGGKICIKKI